MSVWVSGNTDRIFINTSIGCSSHCAYCYLESIGIHEKKDITVDEIIEELENLPFFVQGKCGSIISIGCYYDCWSNECKKITIELLEKLAHYGNYIQFATKQMISEEEIRIIDEIAIFPRQIGIYLSVPTITKSIEIEINAESIEKRLAVLKYREVVKNVYFTLYIKPVLPSITISDLAYYETILSKYNIGCVVGDMFKFDEQNGDINIGIHSFKTINNDEALKIYYALKAKANVYRHSIDVIIKYRRGNENERNHGLA